MANCETDIRPLDYASAFARAANPLLFSEAVEDEASEGDSLGWWRSARQDSGGRVAPREPAEAFRALAELVD